MEIRKVRGTEVQKVVTIPAKSQINIGDYVIIKKMIDEEKESVNSSEKDN